MAYDEHLVQRVRACLAKRSNVVEKKLMGSLAFMVNNSMACAVGLQGLLVRVTPETRDRLLKQANVTPMQMRGRTMQGFVRVADAALRSQAAVAKWVQRGVDAGAAKQAQKPARSAAPKRPVADKRNSIDAYLRTVAEDRRRALEDLRRKIHRVIPNLEECIAYRMPAFRCDGVVIAGFAATRQGCSYFPFSGSTLTTLAPFVKNYTQTKGSLHFLPSKPLSLALVRRLLQTRRAEIAVKSARRRAARG